MSGGPEQFTWAREIGRSSSHEKRDSRLRHFDLPLPLTSTTITAAFHRFSIKRPSNMSQTEDAGNTRSHKRSRSLLLSKTRRPVANITDREDPGLGPAIVSDVESISSTFSGLQPFQSHGHLQSPMDVLVSTSPPR